MWAENTNEVYVNKWLVSTSESYILQKFTVSYMTKSTTAAYLRPLSSTILKTFHPYQNIQSCLVFSQQSFTFHSFLQQPNMEGLLFIHKVVLFSSNFWTGYVLGVLQYLANVSIYSMFQNIISIFTTSLTEHFPTYNISK